MSHSWLEADDNRPSRIHLAAATFFSTIESETRQRQLPFLVIGGHAVNLYGFSRETADLDFLVCLDDRPSWIPLFSELGYHIFNDAAHFVQLASQKETAWPVDLTFVRPATFKPMFEASRVVQFYGTASRVPTLEHLIERRNPFSEFRPIP